MNKSFVFQAPKVGSRITVTSDWSKLMKGYSQNVERISVKRGIVVDRGKLDSPNTFRLSTGNPNFPHSVVSLDTVVDIVYDDNTKAEKVKEDLPVLKSWVVKSASRKTPEKTYTVTYDGTTRHYSCDCLGFQFRKMCKHVASVTTNKKAA
jgi:hypothetical protein